MALKKKKTKKKAVKRKLTAPKRRVVKKKVLPVKKKAAKKKIAKKKVVITAKKAKEKVIGIVTHYFPKVRAAVIKLKFNLAVGDNIKIKGHTTDFTQNVSSMQIERVPLNQAKKGDEIGLLVNSRVRQHDMVYKA